MHMISFLTRIKEKSMINTAWKDLKEVLEVVVEWMIFSACSWVEEAEVLRKSRNNA